MKNQKNTHTVCPYCYTEISGMPYGSSPDDFDFVAYCTECGVVVEGNTLDLTDEEIQALLYDIT